MHACLCVRETLIAPMIYLAHCVLSHHLIPLRLGRRDEVYCTLRTPTPPSSSSKLTNSSLASLGMCVCVLAAGIPCDCFLSPVLIERAKGLPCLRGMRWPYNISCATHTKAAALYYQACFQPLFIVKATHSYYVNKTCAGCSVVRWMQSQT